MTPYLMTERLTLRPLTAADTGFLETLVTDHRVRQYLGGVTPPPEIAAKVDSYFTPAPDTMTWLVTERSGQRHGMVFLDRDREGALALSFQFHPDSWGQGLAAEACRTVIAYARSSDLAPEIVAETQRANLRAAAFLDRLGFGVAKRYPRHGVEQVLYTLALDRCAP